MLARRLIAGVVLLGSTACSTVHSVAPPVTYIQSNSPDQVWITTNAGSQSTIYRPKIIDDSIYGFDMRGQQVTMPVEIVQAAQVKTLNRQKTFLVGAGLAAVAGAGFFVMANNAAKVGRVDCSGNGILACEGKHNTFEDARTSNGGVKVPISASKVVSGVAKVLLGAK